jgi:hypothetical protein
LLFAEVSTKHPRRFSLQAQFKATNASHWRICSLSRIFTCMSPEKFRT